MYDKNSGIKGILRFIAVNKVYIATIAVSLVIIAVVSVLIWGRVSDATENQPSDMLSSNESTNESGSMSTTEDITLEDPIIYPDEIIEFEVPDISTNYLQTDILKKKLLKN